eukprot:TRINITY_DN7524_c0_g1_i1.p1 TRINITY_DN7524_c0_g1~~TRINITY_DN7524_c0_g1_i1.p1  ORF type:complete len:300 (-),score=51.58 TRINITY_DN7524_c0_g1_i1:78-920(-)
MSVDSNREYSVEASSSNCDQQSSTASPGLSDISSEVDVEDEQVPKRRKRMKVLLFGVSCVALPNTRPPVCENTCTRRRTLSNLVACTVSACEHDVVVEIYDFNFHVQPRLVRGIVSKSYYGSHTYVLKENHVVLCAVTTKLHQTSTSSHFMEVLLCATNIYYRKCGAASILIGVMLENAVRQRCSHVVAWSAWTAQDFWIKLGFQLHLASPVELNYFRRTSLVFDQTHLMMHHLKTDSSHVLPSLRKYEVIGLSDEINGLVWDPDENIPRATSDCVNAPD